MLKVNEIFGPVYQGEGKSAGMSCSFLRLALCNLHCIWCDTPYTWNWKDTPFKHPDKYDYDSEVHLMTSQEVVANVKKIGVKSLVISGGEPFLQQKGLLEVVKELVTCGYRIEIETNGTLPIRKDFEQYITQVNCSPKLSNSGDSKDLRIKSSLRSLAKNEKVNFKFVISTYLDAEEAMKLVREYDMKEVYFMPQGRTKLEQKNLQAFVRQLAVQCKVKFSQRLHVLEFDNARGV